MDTSILANIDPFSLIYSLIDKKLQPVADMQ